MSVATTEMNIGIVLKEQGDYENALVHLQKALDINIKCLGHSHVSVADTMYNMSIIYAKLGDESKRLELTRNAHSIYLAAVGPDHPTTREVAKYI